MTKPAVILLVEDNPMDVELVLEAFEQARLGNRVEVVATGEAALQYLSGQGAYADRDKRPMPDLILLDLKLPGMDGFEVLRSLKASPKFAPIPVIVLTSSDEASDEATVRDMGAENYLTKPVDFSGFIEVVKRISDYWLVLNVPPRE